MAGVNNNHSTNLNSLNSPQSVSSLHHQIGSEGQDVMRSSLLHQGFPHGRIAGSSVASLGLSHLSAASHSRSYLHPKPYDYYQKKYRRLKKLIKSFVFINAGVCDEVVRLEEHIARAKEERRFLLRKVLQHQSQSETAMLLSAPRPIPPSPQAGSMKSPGASSNVSLDSSTDAIPAEKTPAPKRKKKPMEKQADKMEKSKAAKELMESLKAKPKRSKTAGGKKVVPPIPLDALGRPVFPLCLGSLTVHSLGEIVTDRTGFHSNEYIYPIGFCSTRVFASTQQPSQSCLYTCKVSESDLGDPLFEVPPKDSSDEVISGSVPDPLLLQGINTALYSFEVSPEDSSDEVISGSFPDQCHQLLLQAINTSLGSPVLDTQVRRGGEFFGFGHPVVQNLIQSCPGAKKCSGYRWVKYEVNKAASLPIIPQTDPTLHLEALQKKIVAVTDAKPIKQEPLDSSGSQPSSSDASTSLRSLLTSGPAAKALSKS